MAQEPMQKTVNHPSFIIMLQVGFSNQEKIKPQLQEIKMELNSITWKYPQFMGQVWVVANFIQVLATMQLVGLQSDKY
jgi:hypothetical protein